MAAKIAVTAAVIENGGLILAAWMGIRNSRVARSKKGEPPEVCLARKLAEEFGIAVDVGQLIAENTHDYGGKVVHLMAYSVKHLAGKFTLADHDQIC